MRTLTIIRKTFFSFALVLIAIEFSHRMMNTLTKYGETVGSVIVTESGETFFIMNGLDSVAFGVAAIACVLFIIRK